MMKKRIMNKMDVFYDTILNGLEIHARYTEANVREIFLPLLRQLSRLQKQKDRRILVMLAAPPGAGKSTLAGFLQKLAAQEAELIPITVIGMDGFHRYQEDLLAHTAVRDGKEVSLVQIKGAPVTFRLDRLRERIRQVAAGEECGWPDYNRLLHNPVEDAVTVRGNIVLLEGNYLLLDEAGWRDLSQFADYTIRIEAKEQMLKDRLIARKEQSGTDPAEAVRFVEFSDLVNVRLCLEHTKEADLTLVLQEDGSYLVK